MRGKKLKQYAEEITTIKEIKFEDIGKIIQENIVSESDGMVYSKGVSWSAGVCWSNGIINCSGGTVNSLFLCNKKDLIK